jgi:hypothetical protein
LNSPWSFPFLSDGGRAIRWNISDTVLNAKTMPVAFASGWSSSQ